MALARLPFPSPSVANDLFNLFYMLQQSLTRYPAVIITLLLLSVQPGKAQSTSGLANLSGGTAHTANASTHSVGGIVTDEYGKPLSGVHVQTKGENNSAFTDAEGHFHIETSFGKMLVFSHPQFDVMEYLPRADTMLPIRMTTRFLHTPAANAPTSVEQKDTIFIPAPAGEPIDVLYGQTDRESFLGSISTVDRKALEATPASNYLFALQGRLTGLNIAQTSGFEAMGLDSLVTAQLLGNVPTNTTGAGPTDNSQFNIQLRAHAGSSGQNPIAIVDGVQRELYSIDPRTIQSVSILKDPLSTLLLGQNSSRGALIVTTNEPRMGPTRLNVTAESGTQTALGLPTPLPAYQYAYLLNEALQNNGKSPIYSQADFDAYRYHTDPIGHPDVNWYHTILRSATAADPPEPGCLRRIAHRPVCDRPELYEQPGDVRHQRCQPIQHQCGFATIPAEHQGGCGRQ
jgi:hypothetical protein